MPSDDRDAAYDSSQTEDGVQAVLQGDGHCKRIHLFMHNSINC